MKGIQSLALCLLFSCNGSLQNHERDGSSQRVDGARLVDGTVASDAPASAIDGAPGPDASSSKVDGAAPSGAWSMGYYASWQADMYPVAEIDWSGLTHVAMSFYEPAADGTLSLLGGNPGVATALVVAAHDNHVKAIASLGGSDSGPLFQTAMAAGTVDAFVANVVGLLDAGYDGIDVDWEPLETTDEASAIDLATRIKQARPGTLMTIPIGYVNANVAADLSGYPAIAAVYDQLNIMSYGMAGAWPGWKSWHNSPLHQTDSATPLSIASSVDQYIQAGVPRAQLGFGIGVYGLCYSAPVTGPDQALGGSTILASDGTMSYANIMRSYYDVSARNWDSLALVPYLSFGAPHAPDGCTYISYDDAQSVLEKGAYLKAEGLGGVILWEINEGYMSELPAGQRHPLLEAVRDNVL